MPHNVNLNYPFFWTSLSKPFSLGSFDLLTFIRLHSADQKLVGELDVGPGATFDLVVDLDLVGAPGAPPGRAPHVGVVHRRHVARRLVDRHPHQLGVFAKALAHEGEGIPAGTWGGDGRRMEGEGGGWRIRDNFLLLLKTLFWLLLSTLQRGLI